VVAGTGDIPDDIEHYGIYVCRAAVVVENCGD